MKRFLLILIIILPIFLLADLAETIVSVSSDIVEIDDDFIVSIVTTDLNVEWDVISYQLSLTYDPALISYAGYSLEETLSGDGTVTVNDTLAGSLVIGFMITDPISGSGSLLNLNFNAISAGTTLLEISDFLYNSTEILNLTAGSIVVNEAEPILADAAVSLTNAEVEAGTEFEIEVLTTELLSEWNAISYQFSLTYDPNILSYQSFNLSGTISQGGLLSVNNSAPGELAIAFIRVTSLHGTEPLLKLVFQAVSEGSCDLLLNNFMYNTTDIADLTSAAVIVNPGEINPMAESTLTVESVDAIVWEEFEIDVNTSELQSDWNIISYQFELSYDPELMSYISSDISSTISVDGTVSINDSQPGELIVGFMSTDNISGSGSLIRFNFRADYPGSTNLALSNFIYNTMPISDVSDGVVNLFTINHDPFVDNPLGNVFFLEDQTHSPINLMNVFSDLDLAFGDQLSYTYSGNEFIEVSIEGGVVTLSTPENWNGNEDITFTATDSENCTISDLAHVTVIPQNDVPVISEIIPPDTSFEILEEQLVDFSVIATDPDGELSYSWKVNSVDQNVEVNQFSYNFQENGSYEIICTLDDGITEIETIWNIVAEITGNDNPFLIPTASKLSGNYPNPFNPKTTIKYGLHEQANVKIIIYNVKGQIVNTLVDETQNAGHHTVDWHGSSDTGNIVGSGLYYYKMVINGKINSIRKCLLLK